MKEWFTFSSTSALAITLTAIGVYLAIIILTRIHGKRSFSKMSGFDFAMTVSIGSIIATTVVSKSVSMWDGIFGITIVYVLQLSAAFLRRFSWFRSITDNPPMILMKEGKIYPENLKKSRVTESDLRSKLREANVTKRSQIRAVIFEATGDVSVLHTEDPDDVEDWILSGVKE